MFGILDTMVLGMIDAMLICVAAALYLDVFNQPWAKTASSILP